MFSNKRRKIARVVDELRELAISRGLERMKKKATDFLVLVMYDICRYSVQKSNAQTIRAVQEKYKDLTQSHG